MPTIKDIAREAGVSHGTVSNVFNKTGKVSVEKIRLVEEAAKRLGYVPNFQAQQLRQGTPTSVAVILPSLYEYSYLDFYSALQLSLQSLGYEVSVYTTNDVAGTEESIAERLPRSSLAAVVTISCLGERCFSCYEEMACPVIYVDRKPDQIKPGHGFAAFDFSAAGRTIGEYILKKQWKKVAVFSDIDAMRFTHGFFVGFISSLSDTSLQIRHYTSDFNLSVSKAFDIAQANVDFDVIIATSALRADAVVSAFRLSAKAQPPIIALGIFNTALSPRLFAYELDYSQMGARISDLLAAHLQKKKALPANTILPAKGFPFQFPQIVRQSLKPLTMLALDTPSTSALEKLLPMFQSVSGIELKMVTVPYDDLFNQIKLLNPNFTYDLVRMDVAWLDSLGKNTYLPLKEAGITSKDLPQRLIRRAYDNYSLVEDDMYSLPFDPSVQILLYRKDLLGDAKLSRAFYERYHEPLCIPQTVEQYLKVAEFFTKEFNPDSPTLYGTTTTNGASATAASDFLPFYLARSGGICDSYGHVRLDSPEMVHALEQYRSMVRFSTQQLWWRDSVQQFAGGNVATASIYSNHTAYVMNSKYSNVVGTVGASVIPGGHPLLGGGIIGISRYSDNIEACRQFFHWYYSPDVASLIVRLGGTSPLVDAYNDFKNFSIFPWLGASKKSFDIGTRGTGSLTVPGFSIHHYEFALGTAVRSLAAGLMSPQEAAAMAQAMYDAAE